MSESCSKKNCNCGRAHVYSDDLSHLSKTDPDKARELHEARRDDLKSQVADADRKRKPIAHLHLHTQYSLLDGVSKAEEYVKLAKEYGHPAMAITDHGNLSGTFEFWKKCKAGGVKPIIGMEAYVNDKQGDFEEKKYEGGNSHQSILVMNNDGYVNLNRLAYRSYDEGFYKRGRIKTEWLFEHKSGLFITTSCAVSNMSKLVREGKESEAEEYLKSLMREFGDNMAAELQFNEFDGQKIYNNWLLKMIKKYSLMPILTNDVHYAFKEDAELQDTLIAINQHSKLGQAFKLNTRNLYYANADDFHEFNKKFGFNYPEKFIDLCLDNTLKVAEKCNFEFETGKEKYPRYEASPEVFDYFKTNDTKEIITRLSNAKLKQKINKYKETGIVQVTPEKEKEYYDRLKYELEVIDSKHMLDYFLVNWEIVKFCKDNDVSTGPGRGCFVPGSRVKMADGMLCPIDAINIGEEVIDAYGDIRKVVDTLEYEIDEDVIEIEFDNGKKITCTIDHEILTKNRGWVKACELSFEDGISQIEEAFSTKIKSKNITHYKGKVYDLTIADTHSYNIDGISVHNSAAGSLLSWALDITKIDPIRFDLYFERFLNPTRKSPPDLDIDYQSDTDQVTNDFLRKKYGKERVLSVATFSTFNEKGCLKDVVRAHRGEDETGFESDVHAVTKEMPNFDKVEYSFKNWLEEWPKNPACSERVRLWLTDPSNSKILDQTIRLQGHIRGVSQHAAGIVITPGSCWEYVPTNIIGSNKSIVTAFQEADKSGKDLSELGILKLDRLKLDTLNVIKHAIKLIKEKKGVDITESIDYIDISDPNLYNELRIGINHGIFQFESPGMNAIVRSMITGTFEEAVAASALYRPGPLGIGAHTDYIKNKFSPEDVKYIHKALEPILSKTNGVLVFQEQLMFIAHHIGGMSLGEGDTLRRYMDKASSAIMKKSSGEELNQKEKDNYAEFEKYWNKFLDGAANNGYKVEEIDVIKDWVIKYLGYSFNRSHSVSYTYLSMQTLYLKHYYPTEFYTALLNHPKTSGGKDRERAWLGTAIASAMSKGIDVKPPSRRSGWNWTMTGDKEISMGFQAINGLGDVAYEELMNLLNLRGKTLDSIGVSEFFDLPFSKFNKSAFESCLKAGVFDEWSESREFLKSLKEKKKKKLVDANQMSLFDMGSSDFDIKTDDIGTYQRTTEGQKRAEFIDVCGFDIEKISNVMKIKEAVNKKSKRPLENILNFENDDWYFFILEDFKTMQTKTGKEYLILDVGDGMSRMSIRAFGYMVKKIMPDLVVGGVYVAKFDRSDGKFINFARNTQFKKIEV